MVEKIIVEGNLYGALIGLWVLNTEHEEILEDKVIKKLVFKNVVAKVKTDGYGHVWLTVKAPKKGKIAVKYNPKTEEAKIYYTK